MSQEPNPKDFYNRSDYTPALAKGPPDSRGGLNKPDETPLLLPPPPYSPASSSGGFPQQQPITTYGTLSTPDHHGYSIPSQPSSSRQVEPSTEAGSRSGPAQSSKANRVSAKSNNETNGLLSTFTDRKNRWDCFKKSLKFLLAFLLLGIGAWKYMDYTRPPPPAPGPPPIPGPPSGATCQGLDAVFWDVLPRHLAFEKEIRVRADLGGGPSSGKVSVRQTPEYRRDGRIEVQVKVSRSISLDDLGYEFKDGQLTFAFPPVQDHSRACVELDMEIWLPERAKVLVVDLPTVPIHAETALTRMDLVDLRGSTVQIQEYEGKELRLSADGDIAIHGPVEARDPVQVTSPRGSVMIKGTIISKKSVSVQTDDGQIEANARIAADDNVIVRTANGPILLHDTIQAETVQVEAANGPVRISSVGETGSLIVKSANGDLDIGPIRSEKDPKIQLTTSNGPVVAHVTQEYEGALSIRTSETNRIDLSDQGENIDLEINMPYMKEGKRLDGDGILTVSTSNADVQIYFDA